MIPASAHPQPDDHLSKRYTVAYMTDGIYSRGGYQYTLWKGICEAAQQNGINLVCFTGGAFKNRPGHEFEYQHNTVFDLITRDCFDGLLISSSALKYAVSQEELEEYFAKFRDLVVISLGLALDDFPSVCIDNRRGVKDLVNHLLDTHGCRHIAFIRGPEENIDAESRFQAYQEALAERSIPIDWNLVVQGGFLREGGEHAIHLLLDENHAKFEAVMSANDGMALGAMRALQVRGMRIPDDVAVTGFDDIPDAQMSFPPLTTARQPIQEIGRGLVQRLHTLLNGGRILENEMIPSQVVIRNSCGCSMDTSMLYGWRTSSDSGQIYTLENRQILVMEMVKVLECPEDQRELASRQAGLLAEEVQSAWEEQEDGSTGRVQTGEIFARVIRTLPLLPWHRVFTVLSQTAWWQEALRSSPARHARFLNDLWQTYTEIDRMSHSYAQLQEHFRQDAIADNFREVSQALSSTFDLNELIETIYDNLPRLGIHACWISLYEQVGCVSEFVRLILAFDRKGRINLGSQDRIYPARSLLPRDVFTFDSYSAVYANALYFRDIPFGFAIFGLDEPDQNIIDTISSQISTALQRIRVMNELKHIQTELRWQANTDPLTGIYNRRMVYNLAEPLFELSRRHHRPLGVAIIDLDDFKLVNDHFGHSVGDQVLREFCIFIKHQIRATDIFGRFGGEEFIIIQPDTPAEEAGLIGARLCKAIASHPLLGAGQQVSLTVSIGGTSAQVEKGQSIDQFISDADDALYQAKQAGKNCMVMYKKDSLERRFDAP